MRSIWIRLVYAPQRNCAIDKNHKAVPCFFDRPKQEAREEKRWTGSKCMSSTAPCWGPLRVREPTADLPLGANRKERSASSCRTASAHRALALDGFDSLPFFPKQKQHPDGMLFCFGAGYGNRTRLCGLGSDHSTDELTLHCRYYSRWGRKNQCLFCRCRISLLSLEKCSPLCYDREKPSKGERLCFRKPF